MEGNQSEGDLFIPEQSSDRDDFIQGIGSKEVGIIVIAFFCIVVYAIVVYVATKNMPFAILNAMFILAITIMTVKRDAINENLIDKIKILIRYLRVQKKYSYEFYDVFDIPEDEYGEEC